MTRTYPSTGPEENLYLVNLGRTQAPDFTPYSAVSTVSSFNLPLRYDPSLITPVSMHSSPSLHVKRDPAMRSPDIMLSPQSPSSSHMASSHDDYDSEYNPPMKYKEYSGHISFSTVDHFFPPGSPLVCSSPYYGNFGVSATPYSAGTSVSPSTFNPSPNMPSSAGSQDYRNGRYQSCNHTPIPSHSDFTYPGSQAPTLIAPSPSSPPVLITPNPSPRRAAPKLGGGAKDHHLSSSYESNTAKYRTYKPEQGNFVREGSSSKSAKSRKKSSPKRKSSPGQYEELVACRELTEQERFLLKWSMRDQVPWKQITARYNEVFPQKVVKEATLQMRRKRLVDRLTEWTATEERALILSCQEHKSGQWPLIAKGMHRHGGKAKWSIETLRSKWTELMQQQQHNSRIFKQENITILPPPPPPPDFLLLPPDTQLRREGEGERTCASWSDADQLGVAANINHNNNNNNNNNSSSDGSIFNDGGDSRTSLAAAFSAASMVDGPARYPRAGGSTTTAGGGGSAQMQMQRSQQQYQDATVRQQQQQQQQQQMYDQQRHRDNVQVQQVQQAYQRQRQQQ
ncbi:uncharacterized protein L3040_007700 [Drepanopeziza brunnea f. sp. 'multigermtubi']|uniref:uncharacterized protein n=1 Tax=Drepanopeziza brunnea f. sp. 'multigermtubi' TaxID=698441 RepID=UPI0023A19CE0|nr:hypothetical protein L3040_007700 [Drepanopeziza brunnea f. sp. 'multigermtubi']